jgi:hypothetical protein
LGLTFSCARVSLRSYANYSNCREVRRYLTSKGFYVDERIEIKGYCIFPFEYKVGNDYGYDKKKGGYGKQAPAFKSQ